MQPGAGNPGQLTDEQAVERYRYLLRTAPPETIEQVHQEAFAQLTPEQRRLLLQQLSAILPEYERRAAATTNPDDPQALARVATRAEMRQPGTLERTFSSMPPQAGVGMGSMMAGNFFSSLAGVMVGSMLFNSFFNSGGGFDQGYSEGYNEGYEAGDDQDAGADTGDTGADDADFGGDTGDMGGDFGGDF
jgi:hypothetical protein